MKPGSKRAQLDIEKLLQGGYKSKTKKKPSKGKKTVPTRKQTAPKRKKPSAPKRSKKHPHKITKNLLKDSFVDSGDVWTSSDHTINQLNNQNSFLDSYIQSKHQHLRANKPIDSSMYSRFTDEDEDPRFLNSKLHPH